ncbi:MAG TPA: hypothetical protein DD434_02200 [Bacteroidales bacterium]|nr:hypothetical protein [Bacteroidales bacterium]
MNDDLLDSVPYLGDIPNPIQVNRDAEKISCYYTVSEKDKKVLLVEIDTQTNITKMYPTNTIEGSSFFLESKYKGIDFVLEGFKIDVAENIHNNQDTIYGLPEGFTKTLIFGLGLEKKYKIIVTTLLTYFSECKRIIISKDRITCFGEDEIIVNYSDFDNILKGINRIHDMYQREAIEAKESLVYESLLHDTDSDKYPKILRKPRKDLIYKILRNTDLKKISHEDEQSLTELKDSTDLTYLTYLCAKFEQKLIENHTESIYQKFFEENTLLLTMFAGSPYIKYKNQAYVGGKSFDNSNGQFPDFLYKHKISNNTFIIEIKKPQTSLLDKIPYRKTGVYSPSKELSGSISQLLTQKYQLETDIATLIKNAEDREVEAYNVQGLIIIGSLYSLENKEMKRSFELYRNNQKNIRIITYDECLEQLKAFIDLLRFQVS